MESSPSRSGEHRPLPHSQREARRKPSPEAHENRCWEKAILFWPRCGPRESRKTKERNGQGDKQAEEPEAGSTYRFPLIASDTKQKEAATRTREYDEELQRSSGNGKEDKHGSYCHFHHCLLDKYIAVMESWSIKAFPEPNARSSLGWRSPNPNPKTKNPNETVKDFARIFFK